MYIKRARKTLTQLALVAAALVAALLLSYHPLTLYSQGTGAPITGWAWSDTIGWVSLSGSGYGLAVNSNGYINGYAWGSNVGWITSDTACGTQGRIVGGTVTGWLHALNTGSEGCISLTSANGGTGYGLSYSGGNITGLAWSSDTIGWLSFNGAANLTPPTCSMNVVYPAPYSVFYSSSLPPSFTITYNTQNATGNVTVTDDNGSYAPSYSPTTIPSSGTSFTVTAPPSATTGFTMTVANSAGLEATCQTTANVNGGFPPPSGYLSASPTPATCASPVAHTISIRKGTTAALCWSVSNINAGGCTLTRTGSTPIGGVTAVNSTTTPVLSQRAEYTLSCNAQDGSTFVDRATINIIPEFIEI